MAAHGVVDQHTFKRLDIILQRLAFGGQRRARGFVIGHQQRRDRPRPPPVLQHRPFSDIDHLAHIARPRGLQQLCRLLRRHLWGITAVFLGKLFGRAGKQRQNIFTACAQWWTNDRHSTQAVKQIGPQHVFQRFIGRVFVANRNDPGFGRHALFVDHRQQPRLQRVAEGFDIFQTQRAAPRFFDQRDIAVVGWPEHLGPQLILSPSGTRHGDKFAPGARSYSVQRMRHKSFASACFAINQHMTICLTQIKNVFAQPVHCGAGPDQFLHQNGSVRQFFAQRPVIQRQATRDRGTLGQFCHPVRIERLFQKVISPDAHRLNRHRHIAMPGDQNNRQTAIHSHQTFEKAHPVHAWHLDIRYHHARKLWPQHL